MLQFSVWVSPANPLLQRIYVRGLPKGVGKAFIARPRGREDAELTIDPPATSSDHEQCLQLVLTELRARGMKVAEGQRPTFAAALAAVSRESSPPAKHAGRPAAAVREARPTYLPTSTPSSATLDFSKIVIDPPLTVYADHREPEAIVQLLRSIPNLTVEVESLPVGDFRAGCLIFERKSVRDFELSVTDGRLFDEATRIGLEPESVGIVIIEGDVMQQGTSLLLQSLQGAVTCLSMVQGLSVLTSPDHVATAYFIAKHVQHCYQGLGYALPLHRSRPKELVTARAYLLQALPGVSGQLATTLLEHFGSAGAVMRATRAQLLDVRGLGPKTADAILAVLA